jgi:predicted lipoprotein with Yx(FWY)xxD motif
LPSKKGTGKYFAVARKEGKKELAGGNLLFWRNHEKN